MTKINKIYTRRKQSEDFRTRKTYPEIKISGEFLREYGFEPGAPVKMEFHNGQIIITSIGQ